MNVREEWTGDSFSAAGSSAMKGNLHVAFLGGKRLAIVSTYPTKTHVQFLEGVGIEKC